MKNPMGWIAVALLSLGGPGHEARGQTTFSNKALATVSFIINGNLQVTQGVTNKCTNAVGSQLTVGSTHILTGVPVLSEVCTNWGNPTCAVFQASLKCSQRTSDWRGTHEGVFRMSCGTALLGVGTMTGLNGLPTVSSGEACGQLSGIMRGLLRQGTSYAPFQANYVVDLTAVDCPSATQPKGPFQLSINGVQTLNRCAECGPP